MHSARGKGGASFPLQLLLIFSRAFAWPWFFLTLALLVYKGTIFPFPPAALPMEIVASFLVFVIQWVACNIGKRGNLTESPRLLLLTMGLLICASVGNIYFMWLQTYVMRLDLGFSATLLAIDGLSLIFCVIGLQNIAGDEYLQRAPQMSMQQQQQQMASAAMPPIQQQVLTSASALPPAASPP